MEKQELRRLAEPLHNIAKAAGKAIMDIYENPALFDVDYKSDKSPLTAADKAANEIIVTGLNNISPVFPIISEESKMSPYSEREQYNFCWMVDPLDGTKEFIQRNGEFTVNIALIHQGNPVAGMVYVPVSETAYFASKGSGAFRIRRDIREQLFCRSFDLSQSGLRILCSRSHLSAETKKYVDQFRNPLLIPQGSALKFTVMAEGEGDIYPRIGPTMEWDTAAAHILLKEAGGEIVEFATGRPLTYNKPNLLNPDFVAYGKGNINLYEKGNGSFHY